MDSGGKLSYQSCRYDDNGEKSFSQRRPDGKGGWINNLNGIELLPYNLPALQAAIDRGDPIFIPEGEKDCDTLAALNLTATTNSGGANKWREEHSRYFPAGIEVIVLPDNDEPGKSHGKSVARQLIERGCKVKVVELPGLPEKGDVSDWLAGGHNKDDLLQIVQDTQYYEIVPDDDSNDQFPDWNQLYIGTPYIIENGRLYHVSEDKNGNDKKIVLANFAARIIREISRDDGQEFRTEFVIEGIALDGRKLKPVNVPASKFNSLAWAVEMFS